jgi:RNA polymerase sigma-70 factor, ECF subfamily
LPDKNIFSTGVGLVWYHYESALQPLIEHTRLWHLQVQAPVLPQNRMPDQDALLLELPAHLPRLWRFALRLTRNEHDAQDLVQLSCLRAIERRHQWQHSSSPLSWLFSVMHSQWINELRSPQRRRRGYLADADGDADGDITATDYTEHATSNPEFSMFCKQVVESVDALPEAQRVTLVLVAAEGMSYREAAEILDVPVGTVMSRLARARLTVGARFLDGAATKRDEMPKVHV